MSWKTVAVHILRREAPLRCLFFVLALFVARATSAEPVIEEQVRLDFGTLAVTGNNSVSSYTMPRTGRNVSIEGNLVLVERGMPGRFLLSGFPPDTTIEVEADPANLTAGGTGAPEPLRSSDYDFSDIFTDDFGEAELFIGATLSTSGDNGSYTDAPYSGVTQLRFHYWEPEVSDFVTKTKTIDLRGEVRSSLQLEEAQQLHFGTLFARTSLLDQASITLAPSGSVSISNPDNARILSLSQPSVGVVIVTGAAPFYELSLALQTDEVVLERTTNPGSAPRFLLNALVSDPEDSGLTDENGELEVRIGGTLSTEDRAAQVYPAGTYEGTYQLTISYQ